MYRINGGHENLDKAIAQNLTICQIGHFLIVLTIKGNIKLEVIIFIILFSPSAFGANIFKPFIDPKDGALDTSNWLVDRKGFLPIPLIITEPAVGFGLGAGLVFFHESKDTKEEDKQEEKPDDDEMLSLPPSISAYRITDACGGLNETDDTQGQ